MRKRFTQSFKMQAVQKVFSRGSNVSVPSPINAILSSIVFHNFYSKHELGNT